MGVASSSTATTQDFLPVGAGVLPPHVENVRSAAAMLQQFERVHEGLTDCRKARMGIPHLQPPAGVLGFIDRDLPAPDPLSGCRMKCSFTAWSEGRSAKGVP